MKVVSSEDGAVIYPFASPDQTGKAPDEYILVYPNGTIWLSSYYWPLMDAEAAQKLAEALQKAVELTESGITYHQRQGPEWVEPGRGES